MGETGKDVARHALSRAGKLWLVVALIVAVAVMVGAGVRQATIVQVGQDLYQVEKLSADQ